MLGPRGRCRRDQSPDILWFSLLFGCSQGKIIETFLCFPFRSLELIDVQESQTLQRPGRKEWDSFLHEGEWGCLGFFLFHHLSSCSQVFWHSTLHKHQCLPCIQNEQRLRLSHQFFSVHQQSLLLFFLKEKKAGVQESKSRKQQRPQTTNLLARAQQENK